MLKKRDDQRFYRTRSQFVIGVVVAVIAAVCAVGYFVQTDKIEVRIAAVGLLVVGGCNLRLAFAGIHSDSEGINVRNVFSSYSLKWSDIHKFRMGPWNIFPYVCLIDLKNGRTKHAFGIQERTNFPNGSAELMAEELNAELAQPAA